MLLFSGTKAMKMIKNKYMYMVAFSARYESIWLMLSNFIILKNEMENSIVRNLIKSSPLMMTSYLFQMSRVHLYHALQTGFFVQHYQEDTYIRKGQTCFFIQ